MTIQKFTDLNTWKESHKLVINIYEITRRFPRDEQFGLTTQIRRAAISVSSNIAEGFGRFTFKEKARFYYQSSGSLSEVENQLIIARDLSYIPDEDYNKIQLQLTMTYKLLHALITKTKALGSPNGQIEAIIIDIQSPISNLQSH